MPYHNDESMLDLYSCIIFIMSNVHNYLLGKVALLGLSFQWDKNEEWNMREIIILLILIATIHPVAGVGMGISPSQMNFDNALKGYHYESSFTIFNTGPELTNFSLDTSGEIGDWVTFTSPGGEELSSIGVSPNGRESLIVRVQVPDTAANGNYTGQLVITSISQKSEEKGSSSSMVVGATADVLIEVTGDQIIQGQVIDIRIIDTEPGYPVVLETKFVNMGNVEARPEILVTIYNEADVVKEFVDDSHTVKPQARMTMESEWVPDISADPGDYNAKVEVMLNKSLLFSDDLDFVIYPVGTLSRQGEVTGVLIEGDLVPENLLKINVYFENTGDIETDAMFKGEVYDGDTLVDIISSDELFVEENKEVILESYFRPATETSYLIRGKVIYSGKETPVIEIPMEVANPSVPGFSFIIAASLIMLLAFFRKIEK